MKKRRVEGMYGEESLRIPRAVKTTAAKLYRSSDCSKSLHLYLSWTELTTGHPWSIYAEDTWRILSGKQQFTDRRTECPHTGRFADI